MHKNIKHLVKVGDKFNRLTVLVVESKQVRKSNKSYGWLMKCLCDCGNICYKVRAAVVVGDIIKCSINCGANTTTEKIMYTQLIYNYKQTAAKRGYKWELSFDDAKALMKANCFYCGVKPYNKTTRHGREQVRYVYSGIDRMINSQGYTVENCVPCCKFCNNAKRTLSVQTFIKKVSRMANYLELQTSYNIIDMARANLI